ncbi:hypothetical protein K435DRAFT_118094 [Dendrothele bispora CBS 962.96]|uniref:Uncharacterized protein n=1 Tax=Dendrothele bispora (strain CBS 962.96) TaxID=1314807 RepID=A0A4S8MQC3_DENBC|nr:hypothetical protein K435DRAFT_118094 [Dendrothele bispora CBS 962.96]
MTTSEATEICVRFILIALCIAILQKISRKWEEQERFYAHENVDAQARKLRREIQERYTTNTGYFQVGGSGEPRMEDSLDSDCRSEEDVKKVLDAGKEKNEKGEVEMEDCRRVNTQSTYTSRSEKRGDSRSCSDNGVFGDEFGVSMTRSRLLDKRKAGQEMRHSMDKGISGNATHMQWSGVAGHRNPESIETRRISRDLNLDTGLSKRKEGDGIRPDAENRPTQHEGQILESDQLLTPKAEHSREGSHESEHELERWERIQLQSTIPIDSIL